MGTSHHAPHQCPQQDISRSHVPYEWTCDGNQRNTLVSQCSTHWSIVRRLGQEVLPSYNSVLHMRSHPADVD